MRAVLDPNVFISALLSPTGIPAKILLAWRDGRFELVVSAALIAELERALTYPKLRKHVSGGEASEFTLWLRDEAFVVEDPAEAPAVRSADPADDYLIAITAEHRVALVSGDRHLLDLSQRLPVFSPRQFYELLPA